MTYPTAKEIASIKETLIRKQGKKALLQKNKEDAEKELKRAEKYYDSALKARSIIQIVAENTQKNIEYHVSNLVTMAMSSVFPDPYTFSLKFVQRRNKTEADLVFSKRDNDTDDILNAGGGGVADVASFALKVSLWSIKRTRPVFLLDESFKFLHNPTYQEKASEMIKEVSRKLNLQVIIVSDQQNILKDADKVIEIENVDGVSKIKEGK